jgi:glycosyltransferase involved in cell wall biosynthesis
MKSQHISIFYDHQASAMQKFGGISRYFDELIAHSNDLFYARKNRFVLRTTKYIVQKKLNIINEIHSYCLAQSADILHPTYYNPWVIRHARKPFVVTVHDMIYEIFPDIFPPIDETSRFKLWMMEHANHIIAISENTKKDILRIYPHLAGSKISVIHHGTSWHAIEN